MATLRPLWVIGVLLSAAALWVPPDGVATGAPTVTETPAAPANFDAFLAELWPDARSRGISRATFDRAFAGLTPDPRVIAATKRQPEYGKPAGAYVYSVVSNARVATGERHGVPPCRDLSGRRAEVRRRPLGYPGHLGNRNVVRGGQGPAGMSSARWRHSHGPVPPSLFP